MSKIYPFKFLDAYNKADTGLFFGRNEEINDLYQMIFQSNILMVYGASGTGKTSLIQCGLAGRFKPHDWLALYVRRGTDMNASLNKALVDAGGINGTSDLQESFKEIYRNSFRPLYLIFDQFEELFVLGTRQEQTQFIQTVKDILTVEQPVKIIFSIREEYVGHLYEFEKEVPQLLRKKLRVEPMNLDKVEQVITGVTKLKGSNISLQAGKEKEIIENIFEKVRVSDNSGTIQLPYLQVFLDKLYIETTHDNTRQADAVFTMEAINKIGNLGDILRDFLEEQVLTISKELSKKYPESTTEMMWDILSPFATLEGTKEPMPMPDLIERLPEISPKLVADAVAAFVTGRILRCKEDSDIYELAHDALAGKIAAKRSDEEVTLLEAKKMLKSYIDIKTDTLSENHLNFVLPFIDRLILTPAERNLIEATQKKIKAEREREKKRFIQILSGMAIALVIMGGLTFWAIQQRSKAKRSQQLAEENINAAQSLALSGLSIYKQSRNWDITLGFRYAQYAYLKDTDNMDARKAIYMAVFPAYPPGYQAEFPGYSPKRTFYKFSLKHDAYNCTGFLSPDGTKIVTASASGASRIWDVSNGKQIMSLKGHKQKVFHAVFSHDGTKVVTASADSTSKVWDAQTGKELAVLKGHTGFVYTAAFSPDDKTILTASADHTARLWNAATGTELFKLSGHTQQVYNALFSPEGSHVLSRSTDTTARLWDVHTGLETARLSGHTAPILAIAFSPDSKKAASASADNTTRVWDVATGKMLLDLRGHNYLVNCVSFSNDGSKIVTGSSDNTAKIWDATTGKLIKTLSGHEGVVNTVVFSKDDEWILTSSGDHSAKVWDVKTGLEKLTLSGHERAVFSAEFAPEKRKILTVSYDKTENFWDVSIGRELYRLLGDTGRIRYAYSRPVYYQVFSPDNRKVVTACYDTTAKIWDVATGALLATLRSHESHIYSAVFSPDGSRILTASGDKTAKIWDTTGKLLMTLRGHDNRVYTALFSPDGNSIITSSVGNAAIVWDAKTGKERARLTAHTKQLNSAVFSPDSKKIVTASSDSTAIVWDAATGRKLLTLTGHDGAVYSAAFSPDSKKIVTGSSDLFAKIWDATTGKDLVTLEGHYDLVSSASFSPNGTQVVTSSKDNTARTWDAATGKELTVLTGHTGFIHTAFFSSDGKTIVTSSGDNFTGLWDAATGGELALLPGNYGYVYAAFFSPDGKHILSVSDDRTSKLWLVSIPDIIKELDNKVDDLDTKEKKHFGIPVHHEP